MLPSIVPDWTNPKSTLIKKNESDLTITFNRTGAKLYILGSDKPDMLRGPNPLGSVLDEYAYQKPSIWNDIVQPVTRANPRAWCWFLFTPQGKNHAYTAYQFGQRPDDPEWKSWKLTATDSGIFTPQQIELAQKDMPQATFQQEMMCEFLEGEGSVFRNVKQVMVSIQEDPVENELYVMGVDLAKVQDYTVIVVYKRSTNKQVLQVRFNKLDWVYQKSRIKELAHFYNNALIMLDATGIGDPIADDLMRAGCAVEPFKITEMSKKDIIDKLSIWIEQRRFSMLDLPETSFEFDNFSYEITQTGRIRYQAREGFHDDIVIAHALAIWSLQPITTMQKPENLSIIARDIHEKTTQSEYDEEYDFGYEEVYT